MPDALDSEQYSSRGPGQGHSPAVAHDAINHVVPREYRDSECNISREIYFPAGAAEPGGVTAGKYKYWRDLQGLEATATGAGPKSFHAASPLKVAAWRQALAQHPHQEFVDYMLTGMQYGFHIGAQRSRTIIPARTGNLPSVKQQPHLVAKHLATEVAAGRLLGPLPSHLARLCQVSPIGLIPKPHQPGKWRLIVDLSSPRGASVNDAITSALCHMHYASVLQAASIVRRLGPGTLLAKIDLLNAYRIVPVHPDDHPLLAVRWGSDTYLDTALPFGLRSAPKIFSALADALEWVLASRGVQWQLHYLDDFLFCGPPGTSVCAAALETALRTCGDLGVPVAMHKLEGPATRLTFLGIQIDTEKMSLSLADDKLARLQALVATWQDKRVATKRELQSLIGHLSHAAFVVRPGRTFLRRMIDTMSIAKQPHHHVRLNTGFRSDLHWWAAFLPMWNGRSILPPATPAHTLTSDASGTLGCGAVSDNGNYFQLRWPESWAGVNIAVKEMVPVVLSVAVWGSQWATRVVRVRSDNMAVVHALSAGAAKDAQLMHLLRCLHFFTAHLQISIQAEHVAGTLNSAADALSRDNLTLFFQCIPQAAREPTLIPAELVDMLVLQCPDWTSDSWRTMFLTFWERH